MPAPVSITTGARGYRLVAADIVEALVRRSPDAVLGLATRAGDDPVTSRAMALSRWRWVVGGRVDAFSVLDTPVFSRIRVELADEAFAEAARTVAGASGQRVDVIGHSQGSLEALHVLAALAHLEGRLRSGSDACHLGGGSSMCGAAGGNRHGCAHRQAGRICCPFIGIGPCVCCGEGPILAPDSTIA